MVDVEKNQSTLKTVKTPYNLPAGSNGIDFLLWQDRLYYNYRCFCGLFHVSDVVNFVSCMEGLFSVLMGFFLLLSNFEHRMKCYTFYIGLVWFLLFTVTKLTALRGGGEGWMMPTRILQFVITFLSWIAVVVSLVFFVIYLKSVDIRQFDSPKVFRTLFYTFIPILFFTVSVCYLDVVNRCTVYLREKRDFERSMNFAIEGVSQ